MQKISDFSERLEYLIDILGFKNTNKFVKKLGYKSPEKILRLLRHKSNKPSYDIIKDIANKFENVNLKWLLTGEGNALISNTENLISDKENLYSNKIIYIDSADTILNLEQNEKPNINHKIIYIPGFEDCDIAIKFEGDSMEPQINSGDIIMCKKVHEKKTIIFGEVYLLKTADHILIKYIKKANKDNEVTLSSENSFYDDFNIKIKDIIQVFIVKGIIRRKMI